MISNKVSFGKKGFKYFMSNKDAKKIRPVCPLPPKMTAYRKDFDETKFMSFLIKDDIWEKVKDSLKKEFDSKLVYKKKKAKIKSYNGKINTNFHNNRIPKEGSQYLCFLVILIDSVFRTGKHYYPQVILEEFKYVVKEKKDS